MAPSSELLPPPTLEQALVALDQAKVIFGIDPGRVAAALGTRGQPVLVAEGRSARDGDDAQVEFATSLLAIGGRPQLAVEGTVDLFDLHLVHNVEAGAVLATLTLPTSGEAGVTVSGKPIAPRPGQPSHVRTGIGACLAADGLHVLAAAAGHATLVGDLVTVSDIYQVRGDVGPATGNIKFVGSVSISGDVDAGYRVQAGGDVEVQGCVAGGDVAAAGNISIRYGIQGHAGPGRVVAGGVVRAKFIEFAHVQAGGSVYASDGIVRSTVEAGERVEVLGRHGSIVGGRIQAGEAVSARDLGSPRGILTEILVLRDAVVTAQGTCHAEVRISIGDATYVVAEARHGVRFERHNLTHEIEPHPQE